MPGLWEEWFESAGVAASKRKAGLRIQNAAQVLEAVQSDECIGLVDQHLVRSDVEAGRIATAYRHTYAEGDACFLVPAKDADRSAARDFFRQWLRDQVPGRKRAADVSATGD